MAASYGRLVLAIGVAAWDASARLSTWVVGHCRGGNPQRTARARAGAGVRRVAGVCPAEIPYAPSTLRRYREITVRFAAWAAGRGSADGCQPDCAEFFAEMLRPGSGNGVLSARGQRDPQHLALRRTTICALRAAVDRTPGTDPTAGLRLPARPPPVAAATAQAVAALRGHARREGERLLLILACDVGLRPGQIIALRWRDVCLRARRVRVAKRRGTRDVPIPVGSMPTLARLTRCHGPEDFLIPSARRGLRYPTTVRTLQNVLRRLVQRSGAPPDTTFTRLRKLHVPPAPEPGTLSRALCSGRRKDVSPARSSPSAAPPVDAQAVTDTPVSAGRCTRAAPRHSQPACFRSSADPPWRLDPRLRDVAEGTCSNTSFAPRPTPGAGSC
jgi:site-specific recombinase XerC